MNNPRLSETRQTEQQSEEHARPESQNTEKNVNASLHPLLQMQQSIGNRAVGQIVQRKEAARPGNKTGLPDNLKTGLEYMSGMSMDDVKVHYNSPEPSRVQALAYTKGSDIHLAPGQEKHLPHEAWHAVQQKQRRVAPTMQLKGEQVNDDSALEHEADMMGARAAHATPNFFSENRASGTSNRASTSTTVQQQQSDAVPSQGSGVVQRVIKSTSGQVKYQGEVVRFLKNRGIDPSVAKALFNKYKKKGYDETLASLLVIARDPAKEIALKERAVGTVDYGTREEEAKDVLPRNRSRVMPPHRFGMDEKEEAKDNHDDEEKAGILGDQPASPWVSQEDIEGYGTFEEKMPHLPASSQAKEPTKGKPAAIPKEITGGANELAVLGAFGLPDQYVPTPLEVAMWALRKSETGIEWSGPVQTFLQSDRWTKGGQHPEIMNCWQTVLYAGLQANIITSEEMKLANVQKEAGPLLVDTIMSVCGDNKVEFQNEATKKEDWQAMLFQLQDKEIPQGYVVAIGAAGEHVALSTGKRKNVLAPKELEETSGVSMTVGHGLLENDSGKVYEPGYKTGVRHTTLEDALTFYFPTMTKGIYWASLPKVEQLMETKGVLEQEEKQKQEELNKEQARLERRDTMRWLAELPGYEEKKLTDEEIDEMTVWRLKQQAETVRLREEDEWITNLIIKYNKKHNPRLAGQSQRKHALPTIKVRKHGVKKPIKYYEEDLYSKNEQPPKAVAEWLPVLRELFGYVDVIHENVIEAMEGSVVPKGKYTANFAKKVSQIKKKKNNKGK